MRYHLSKINSRTIQDDIDNGEEVQDGGDKVTQVVMVQVITMDGNTI